MTGPFNEPDGATALDPDEMEGLLHSHVTTREELNGLEAANITEGLQWLSRRRGDDIFTEDFVRSLHRHLFGEVWEWAGQFRRTEKNIGIDPLYIGVQLRDVLEDARYWAEHNTYPPLETAARFHYRLVYIHPFTNGNGRHARIMGDTFLKQVHDLPPIDWSNGYDLNRNNDGRNRYLSALREADAGNYTPLVDYVGGGG
jgi:Fic-DOC domain mobile mystery protein B